MQPDSSNQPLYPNYEQPPSSPAPGYGQPQPSQAPYYGPNQPYPGSGPYYAPSQPYPPVATLPPTPPRRSRAGLIIGLVAGVLVIAVVAVGLIHYFGPTNTVQTFFHDAYVTYDGQGVYNLLCSDAQAQVGESQIETALAAFQAKSAGSYNIANLTYTLVNEDFFGEANVRVGGSLTGTFQGQPITLSFINPTTSTLTLRSTGLGWCLTSNNLSFSNSTTM